MPLNQDYRKTVVLSFLTLLCVGLAYYSHFGLRSDIVFSHLYYVPVALAGFWWGRRGVSVGILLGVALIVFHVLSDLEAPIREDLFRSGVLVVVGLTVGTLRERAMRSEEDLRETRDYLDSLIRYANAPIIVWDPAFKITRFNHAFERLTGLRASEVIGASLEILFPKDRREEALAHIQRTEAGERWDVVEIPIHAVDGSIKTVLWNSANVYAADGKTVVATIAQGQDITERLQAAHVLRRTEHLAAMGRLAAALAHEINNPLQAIRSHLELVLDFGLEMDEREQYLRICRKEIERLTDITQRVLSFARPARDIRQSISIAELTERTLALVGKQLQHANVRVTTDFPIALPQVLVAADHIVQVLLNIMINATEVMPEGGRVHVAARAEADVMVLTLSNNGPPIPHEHIGRIFDPFFSTKPDGTGLGLSISYSIIQAHGGDIRAENLNDGQGVRFTITLPTARHLEAQEAQEDAVV
jgi:PAS domain S-box-containing protein